MTPLCKRPRVKTIVETACEKNGITIDRFFAKTPAGGTRTTKAHVNVRRDIIASLYDPRSVIRTISRTGVVYGVNELARILDVDHKSVHHAVVKMGIHPNAKQS